MQITAYSDFGCFIDHKHFNILTDHMLADDSHVMSSLCIKRGVRYYKIFHILLF